MNLKTYAFILVVFVFMAGTIKWLYDGKQELSAVNEQLRTDKAKLNEQLSETVKENALKLEALSQREKSLINDKKEILDEYNKLLELKKQDACYLSWSDVLLPDNVAMLLQ